MVLLILIALAQLVVMVLPLGVVLEQVTRQEIERATAEQSLRRQQHQTIDALLQAAAGPGRRPGLNRRPEAVSVSPPLNLQSVAVMAARPLVWFYMTGRLQ